MGKRILVVDDDLVVRVIVRDMLDEGGHTVVGEASTGEEAIAKYEELHPELVLMDIVLPNKNGLDAAAEILAHDHNARIIVTSVLDNIQLIKATFAIGAADFIRKPFSAAKLLEAINKVCPAAPAPVP
jgi:two-component system chemotaxis response regulator CheY